MKKFYCQFFRCFLLRKIFSSCLAYSETQFGIFCLCTLANTGEKRNTWSRQV